MGATSIVAAKLAGAVLGPAAKFGTRKLMDKLIGTPAERAIVVIYDQTLAQVVDEMLKNGEKNERNHIVSVCKRVLEDADGAGYLDLKNDHERALARMDFRASEDWFDSETLPIDIGTALARFDDYFGLILKKRHAKPTLPSLILSRSKTSIGSTANSSK